jgi:hypothetical protein
VAYLQSTESESEITEYEWTKMWENFKKDAKLILGELRTLMSKQIDLLLDIKEWDALTPIIQGQPRLEAIINESGPRTGWTRNPTPFFEALIKAMAEFNHTEFNEMLEEVHRLKKKAEDILAVP